MKIYISGPISGRPSEEVNLEFNLAEKQLSQRYPDSTIVNPINLCPVASNWKEAMRIDLKALLDCDCIALLPGWEKSKGAKLEFLVATNLGASYIINGELHQTGNVNIDNLNIIFSEEGAQP